MVESYLSVQPHHCQNGTLTVITNTQVPPNATLHVGQLSYKSSAVCSGNRCSVTNLDVTPYSKSQLNMSFFIRGDTREEWGRPLPDLKDCKYFQFVCVWNSLHSWAISACKIKGYHSIFLV